jgi:antibiotic biosynthesis monooxygenase (ABM) superfamily enzyme
MNGNPNGAKTLAYMGGEKGFLVERKRLAELRRQFNGSGLKYWLSNAEKPQMKKFWKMVVLLEENSRMTSGAMKSISGH